MHFVVTRLPFPVGADQRRRIEICARPNLALRELLPIVPVTAHAFVLCAISLTAPRNCGSFVKNGAGDSGQTTSPIFAAAIIRDRFAR